MLWYKSWLETRWRFLIGVGLLLCSAGGTVLIYPKILQLADLAPVNASGPIAESIRESIELSRQYQGYIWLHWFRQNGGQWTTLFAILLGTAGTLSPSSGALFTLSLPVSRRRLLGIRAATGLAELLVIAFVPALLIPLLSPAIHESYALSATLIHGFCLFVAASLFFSAAFLLSTIFDDLWRPLLIALAIAFALALIDQILKSPSFSVYHVMSGEAFFRGAGLPLGGLLVTSAVSAILCYGAAANIMRRDF